jgi:hypothetical protein
LCVVRCVLLLLLLLSLRCVYVVHVYACGVATCCCSQHACSESSRHARQAVGQPAGGLHVRATHQRTSRRVRRAGSAHSSPAITARQPSLMWHGSGWQRPAWMLRMVAARLLGWRESWGGWGGGAGRACACAHVHVHVYMRWGAGDGHAQIWTLHAWHTRTRTRIHATCARRSHSARTSNG